MSDATLHLFISVDFLIWVVIGSLVALAAFAWALITSRPTPTGRLLLSGGISIALSMTRQVPTVLVPGLILLAVVGWVPRRTLVAGMVATTPGAIVVGSAFLERQRPEVIAFVVAIIVSAPLISSFDKRYLSSESSSRFPTSKQPSWRSAWRCRSLLSGRLAASPTLEVRERS